MFILLLNRGLFSPDSCYYQAERGLSTTKINKNKVLKTFTGHQYKRMKEFGDKLQGHTLVYKLEKHTDDWDKPYSCQIYIFVSSYY